MLYHLLYVLADPETTTSIFPILHFLLVLFRGCEGVKEPKRFNYVTVEMKENQCLQGVFVGNLFFIYQSLGSIMEEGKMKRTALFTKQAETTTGRAVNVPDIIKLVT